MTLTTAEAPGAMATQLEYDTGTVGGPVRPGLGPPRRNVLRTWSSTRRAAHAPWLGWPLVGLLLLILGLALPWFAIPLQAQQSAWSLPVVLAGMPSVSWVSYGAVLAACLALGCLAMIRRRGRPCAATAAIGAGILVVMFTFLMATGTADWPLLQQLEDQTAQQAAIFGQFGYTVSVQQPSSMLLVPVTGTAALLAGALRLGWFTAAAGGLVLFGSGAPSLARWLRPAPRRWKLLPALGLLLLAGVLGRGAIASYLAGQGAAAARSGDYQAARSTLTVAQRLNPRLTSSTAYDLASGQVLLADGSEQSLALLADANARGADGDVRGQVTELRKAVARDPANPVLVQQLDQASQFLGLTDRDPGPLQALGNPSVSDEYTEGRLLYGVADYTAALASFRRVLTMTGDTNVTSSAFTYIALSELKLGQANQARRDLLRAVSLDTPYDNTLARSLVAGLFVGTKTGSA